MYLSNSRLRHAQTRLAAQDNFVSVRANTPGSKPEKASSVYTSTRVEDKSGKLSVLYTASETYTRVSDSKLRPEKPMERPSSSRDQGDTMHRSFSRSRQESMVKRLSDLNPGRAGSSEFSWTPQYNSNNNSSQLTRARSKSPSRGSSSLEDIIRQQVAVVPKKYTFGSRQIRHTHNNRPELPKSNGIKLPNYEAPKYSAKGNGLVKCYSACTNQGPIRQYNQDRVSIILNIAKPERCLDWKKAGYFAVFDGHGGTDCADFLRDELHRYLVKQKKQNKLLVQFPTEYPLGIIQLFLQVRDGIFGAFQKPQRHRQVGIMCFSHTCYIANVGDSRAIMSSRGGQLVSQLSIDHKANDEWEQKRIIDNGGRIYQTKLQNSNPSIKICYDGQQLPFILGPHRVFPGRLSVTRSFGDIQAKLPQFGGNPRAIICTPQIRSFKLTPDNDFILLASDGIFDKLNNCQVVEAVWQTKQERHRFKNIHEFCGAAVDNIMHLAVLRKTLDNITVVMLGFQGLEKRVYPTRDLEVNADDFVEKVEEPKIAKSTSHLQKSSGEYFKPMSDSQTLSKQGNSMRSSFVQQKRNSLTGNFFQSASTRLSQKLKQQRLP